MGSDEMASVGNPFYDASVHSMGLSWHNFLFGAFDPGAILSVDKPLGTQPPPPAPGGAPVPQRL